jgi:hypothetical protein
MGEGASGMTYRLAAVADEILSAQDQLQIMSRMAAPVTFRA